MHTDQHFQLDTRLNHDTYHVASWPLCDVLLMNDRQYPWCILVPRVANLREIYQLSSSQRQQLDIESIFLSKTLMQVFEGEKLNVAALGNVVQQLHIHHVIRYDNDPAWPAPIWGKLPVESYSDSERDERLAQLTLLKDPDWAAIALANH